MRVGRIVQLLLLLPLLLLEKSGGVAERGWRRTQITSPWNIKGAVPAAAAAKKRSHEEEQQRLNSLRQNSWGQLADVDNLKALRPRHEHEECIAIRNGRYVVCPTFESQFGKQLEHSNRPKRSSYSREDNDGVGLSGNMTNFLLKVQSQLRGLLVEIDTFLKENEEIREKDDPEYQFYKFVGQIRIKLDEQKRRKKRHVSHHHSSSDDWTYQPQGYLIYDFNTPMVLLQWPTISPEYEREIYNLLMKNNRRRHHTNRRKNHHREHVHEYGDERRESEEYEDYTEETDKQLAARMGSFNNVPPTQPTDAPLSHMLQHIYPPWPMNKTMNRYKKP